MNLYFKNEIHGADNGYQMESRAHLAWDLLRTSGILMATRNGEDSAGRAAMEPMPPQKLVERALSVAEIFVAECEKRNYWVAVEMTLEDASRESGRLEGIRSRASYRVSVEEREQEKA